MPEISAARYRAGSGEPLVLVHGFTATWRCWQPVLADLAARFEVIAPTLHAHDGGPPAPGGPARSMAQAADHFELLLDDLGVEHRAPGRELDGRRAGARAGQARPRAQRRGDLARRRLGPGRQGASGGGSRASSRAPSAWPARWRRSRRRSSRGPCSRRLALRDVMARGDLVPPGEALQLIRSSVRCDAVPARARVACAAASRTSPTSTGSTARCSSPGAIGTASCRCAAMPRASATRSADVDFRVLPRPRPHADVGRRRTDRRADRRLRRGRGSAARRRATQEFPARVSFTGGAAAREVSLL